VAVYADYRNIPASAVGMAIALGNFDGIHAGHRAVIAAARATGHKLAIATFEPPPRALFRPEDPPFRIYSPERRNAALLALGADCVFELPFTKDMAGMTDDVFAREVLSEGLQAAHVAVGFDFRFGRGRMGDAPRLASLGRALGFGVSIVEKVEGLGDKASSTAMRQALRAGEPEKAASLLGHDWTIDGVVEHGEKQGRTLGFPTANITLGTGILHPRHGIYAVRARIEGEAEWRNGVANFGRTPTTGLRDPLLETMIFDWDGDLYGKSLEVALVAFLRPELKFDQLDDMVAQMHKDVDAARTCLSG
jgi:riboflavin kinase/FMN adenylyltransferase